VPLVLAESRYSQCLWYELGVNFNRGKRGKRGRKEDTVTLLRLFDGLRKRGEPPAGNIILQL